MKKFTLSLLTVFVFSLTLSAQDTTSTQASEAPADQRPLTIGVKKAPPFVNINSRGEPTGLSVEFWDLVNDEMPRSFEYKTYDNVDDLLMALKKEEVDMSINPLTVTDQRMKYLDFSQPFFISGTTMVRKTNSRWVSFLSNFFSWQFFSAVLILLLVILIFGTLMWLFERRANPKMFGKGLTGLADGFWWSAVTMTTVGYGDKAPISKGGRVIGFIWMFAAILIISGLTASIASALTVSTLENKIETVEDLRKFKIGTIGSSSSAEYLDIFEVHHQDFTSISAGLQAVKEGKIHTFVYDRPLLRHHLNQGDFEGLKLAPEDLKTDYYSFSYPKGSLLKDQLDPQIVKQLKSPRWNRKLSGLARQE